MFRLFSYFFVAIIILCFSNSIEAQRLITVKGLWGLYYQSVADIKKQQNVALNFYAFTPGDTIGSVGAQACNWEAAYAALSDSLFFFLEDIDTVYCNNKQASLAWQYYSNIKGAPLTSRYSIITGTETATNIPSASCNKILIINSFHEFTDPAEMLHDIVTKLKPGGILFIDETLAMFSGELHPVCKKRIYLEDELIEELKKNGFTFKNSVTLAYHKQKPVRKIFAFTKNAG